MSDHEEDVELAELSDRTPIAGVYTCPACGHASVPDAPPGKDVLQCSECRCIIALGIPQPKVIVQPDASDQRFILLTFETMVGGQRTTATYKVIRGFGKAIGHNILSICP